MPSKWRTLAEVPIHDIVEWVKHASAEGQAVHIGTDSLQTHRNTQFVTVVVIHTPTKGGRVAYAREVVPRITSIREKLLKEVWRSVELAMAIHPHVPGELTVHIDASPTVQHKSSKYIQELVGLVVGQGFSYLVKPDAWAATHVGDWTVRHLGKVQGVANV